MAKFITITNGIPYLQNEASALPPYDESIYYDSGLTANTNITLPNSGSFTDSSAKDILVILNNTIQEVTRHFTVVGSGPTYTQIKFGMNLPVDSVLRFKKNI